MGYMVVEKDVDDEIGYIHPLIYDDLKKAKDYVKVLQKSLGKTYYKIFVCEVGQ